MKYDVFISCKSEDYRDAVNIYKYLADNGLKPFLADAELHRAGRSVYGKIIDAALESADHFLLFASDSSYVTTAYVETEWRIFIEEMRAGRKKGNFISVLKGTNVAELPIALRHFQTFDYGDYSEILDYLPHAAEKVVVNNRIRAHHAAKADVSKNDKNDVKTIWKIGDHYSINNHSGIVFWVDATGEHGKIVSIDQACLPWSTPGAIKKCRILHGSSSDDGKKNTLSVVKHRSYGVEEDLYPALYWCMGHGTGWYMPALNEVKLFLTASSVIKALKRYGGKLSKDAYWSSTEVNSELAYTCSGDKGAQDEASKDIASLVRAVYAF